MTRPPDPKSNSNQREELDRELHLSDSLVLRAILILIGGLAVALGILGIFLPLVPTTPLLLLAAACFARASRRCYLWLLNNRLLGPYIREWRQHRSLSRRAKVTLLALLWGSFILTSCFALSHPLGKALVFVIPIGITVFVLRVPTRGMVEESA